MDISAEIAAIQAVSQGSELRQPLVGALNKLNSGSLPAVTVSDVGKILKVGANGWEVGEKSGYMPVPTATKQITENGTYDVTNYANAVVNVSGGQSLYNAYAGTDAPSQSLGVSGEYYLQHDIVEMKKSIDFASEQSFSGTNTRTYGNVFTLSDDVIITKLYGMTKALREATTVYLIDFDNNIVLEKIENISFSDNAVTDIQLNNPISANKNSQVAVVIVISSNYSIGNISYASPGSAVLSNVVSSVQGRYGGNPENGWTGTSGDNYVGNIGFYYETTYYKAYIRGENDWIEL